MANLTLVSNLREGYSKDSSLTCDEDCEGSQAVQNNQDDFLMLVFLFISNKSYAKTNSYTILVKIFLQLWRKVQKKRFLSVTIIDIRVGKRV